MHQSDEGPKERIIQNEGDEEKIDSGRDGEASWLDVPSFVDALAQIYADAAIDQVVEKVRKRRLLSHEKANSKMVEKAITSKKRPIL